MAKKRRFPKQCEHCKAEFLAWHPRAKFCSVSCGLRFRKTYGPKKCEHCQSEFLGRRPAVRFCSIACSNRFHVKYRRRTSYPAELVDRVGGLYREGKSQYTISKLLGINQVMVSRLMRLHGLSRRIARPQHYGRLVDDPTQLAYAAGIIDGEGCVGSARVNGQSALRHLNLTVTNTNKDVINWLLERLGGTVVAKIHMQNPRAKPVSTWRLYGTRASRFLELVSPYLVIKNRQAAVGIEMMCGKDAMHINRNGNGWKRYPASPSEIWETEYLCRILHRLNKKGREL